MTVVLIDTNVWVSALINPHGTPAELVNAWIEDRFQAALSAYLLDEIAEVLSRPRIQVKYRVDSITITTFLQLLSDRAIHVFPTWQFPLCRDPDDNLILETAILARARYAISRDDDLKRDPKLVEHMQQNGVNVVSVRQFLHILNTNALEQ